VRLRGHLTLMASALALSTISSAFAETADSSSDAFFVGGYPTAETFFRVTCEEPMGARRAGPRWQTIWQ
jgi:hypothetical protein